MSIRITVRGAAERSFAPERATVVLAATAEGPDREQVAASVASVHASLTSRLGELARDGVVGTWSAGQVSTWSHRPWDERGQQGEPVQVGRAEATVEVVDLEALSGVVDGWTRTPGLELQGVAWDLTRDHRLAREAEVRRLAVDDLVAKARAYADALGAGEPSPVEVADAGMLDGSGTVGAQPMFARAMADAGGAELVLRPVDIVIAVEVDGRFTA